MKYSFSTFAYSSFPTWLPAYTLDETIRRLSRLGYDGVEIGCAAPHAWPAFLSAGRRKEISSLLDGSGIKASSLLPVPGGGPGCNPCSPLAEERAFAVSHYKEVIDLGADLGAGIVLYIAGWQIFGTSQKDALSWSRDCLAKISPYAAERNIVIAVEPTPADSNVIETPYDALELMEATGMPNVKVMFDTIHALYRNEVPADYVRIMGRNLAHMHASDRDRKAPCGGSIDWLELFQALQEAEFDGYVTMEVGMTSRALEPDDVARRSIKYLKSIEEQLGRPVASTVRKR
jgi:protein FrlC